MTKDEIIKQLLDMAKYSTVTLPRDCEALKAAAKLLAQPEPKSVKLNPEDVVVEQYVIANSGFALNKAGVRLTHKLTGRIVQVNEERSQHRNRAVAWEMLERLVASEPSKIDPIAVVTGTHAGYFVVKPTDPAMVLPVNMALYTHPKE